MALSRRIQFPPYFPAITLCQGFPDSELLTFWAGQFFAVGDSPVHCRMCGSLPGLYPLKAKSISLVVTTKNVSGHCQCPLGHQICHQRPLITAVLCHCLQNSIFQNYLFHSTTNTYSMSSICQE